jgi:hypothetical protein
MEAVRFFVTSVQIQTVRSHIPENARMLSVHLSHKYFCICVFLEVTPLTLQCSGSIVPSLAAPN